MKGDREKALDAGMDDHIPKPDEREDLGAMLQRWVSREDVTPGAGADGRSSPSHEDEDSLDRVVIADMRELWDPDLLSELAGMFLDAVRERLGALRVAIEKRDARSVTRIAHPLKGSSSNMGARRMSRLCLDLEQAGESNVLDSPNKEFDRVVRAQLSAPAG